MNAVARSVPFRRDTEAGIISGVLAGLARRLDLDPMLVRITFAAAVVLTGGLALPAYAVAWAVVPAAGDGAVAEAANADAAPSARRFSEHFAHPGWRIGAGAALITFSALLTFRQLGIWWSDALVWPAVLAGAGAAVLWRQSRESADATAGEVTIEAPAAWGKRHRRRPAVHAGAAAGRDVTGLYRGGFGIALVVGAVLLFLSANDALGATREAVLVALGVLVALALVLAPFLWRLGRNLAAERTARIRTQERADIAAHLHDSVLQTLTLMQKRASDPREVATLARRQERELRAWLFDAGAGATTTFTSAMRAAAEEVEDAHGVAVEVVAVGDAELDAGAEALVGAAREALVNAAKFAPDSGPVALYAEADAERLQAFVRDRGPGFDPARIPPDRRGVRESIVGRMERHGGEARIDSRPGHGTEVELTLERGNG